MQKHTSSQSQVPLRSASHCSDLVLPPRLSVGCDPAVSSRGCCDSVHVTGALPCLHGNQLPGHHQPVGFLESSPSYTTAAISHHCGTSEQDPPVCLFSCTVWIHSGRIRCQIEAITTFQVNCPLRYQHLGNCQTVCLVPSNICYGV